MIGWVGGRGGEAHKAEEEEDKEGEGGGGTGGDVGEIGRRRRARGVAEEREVSSGSRQPCFGFASSPSFYFLFLLSVFFITTPRGLWEILW